MFDTLICYPTKKTQINHHLRRSHSPPPPLHPPHTRCHLLHRSYPHNAPVDISHNISVDSPASWPMSKILHWRLLLPHLPVPVISYYPSILQSRSKRLTPPSVKWASQGCSINSVADGLSVGSRVTHAWRKSIPTSDISLAFGSGGCWVAIPIWNMIALFR